MMSEDDPITLWLNDLRQLDDGAANKLWNHYCSRLRTFARSRLPDNVRRVYDEDDAAVSAFFSLCRGVKHGRFPALGDRNDLWRLLVVIAARKVRRRQEYENRRKRGGGGGDLSRIFTDASDLSGLKRLPSREPTPEFAAEVAETCDALFRHLSDDSLRDVARGKLEGFTNQEIAEQLDIGLRSVERKLHLIRQIWQTEIDDCDN